MNISRKIDSDTFVFATMALVIVIIYLLSMLAGCGSSPEPRMGIWDIVTVENQNHIIHVGKGIMIPSHRCEITIEKVFIDHYGTAGCERWSGYTSSNEISDIINEAWTRSHPGDRRIILTGDLISRISWSKI